MANEIDELVVKIKGDVKDLESKLKTSRTKSQEAASGIQKAFGGLKGPLGEGIAGFRKYASAIVAVAGPVAMGALIKKSLDSADAIAKLGSNTGISTDLLQELSFAASQTGVSQNDLNSSLLRFNRRIADAAKGNAEFAKGFQALGVSVKDSNGKLRSTEDILFEVADGVQGLNTDNERASALFKVFGDSGFKLVNLFKGGSTQLNKFRTEAQALGIVIDADLLKAAEKTNDQLDVLSKVVGAQVTKAVVELAPQIQKLAKNLTDFAGIAAKAFSGSLFDKTPQERIDELRGKIKDLTESINNPGIIGNVANIFFGEDEVIKGKKQQLVALEAELNGLTKSIEGQASADEMAKSASAQATDETRRRAEANKALIAELEKRDKIQKEAQKLVTTSETADPGEKLKKELETLEAAKEQKVTIEGDLNAAIMAKSKELEEFKTKQREDEIERLLERNEMLAELDLVKNEEEIARNQEKVEALMAQEKEGSDFAIKMKLREKQRKQELNMGLVSDLSTTFGNLMTLTQGKSRELFEISKRAAEATAITQGFLAVQRALANPPGPPFSIAQAAAAGTTAAVNVARIEATQFQDGINSIPGIGTQDNFPALLAPRERVVQAPANKDLTEFLSKQNSNQMQPGVVNNNSFNFGNVLGDDNSALFIVSLINKGITELGLKLRLDEQN